MNERVNPGWELSRTGKESVCNTGDPSLIPGSGRSAGEGIGHPLQYSWAYLVAQLVRNAPAMRETWVWSLGWEDLLEKEMATHASIQAWRIPWIGWIVHGVTKSWMWLSNFHFSWTPWEFSLIFHGFKYVDSSPHDRQEEKRKWRSGKGFLVFQILPSHLKSCEYTSMRVSAIFWMILKQSILLILNSNIS